jgi:NTP pyrophosphatase (non-canonical NTP hydrolase)
MTREENLMITLMEELAEVQQELSKYLRFTPYRKYNGRLNIEKLREELMHVDVICSLLASEGILLWTHDGFEEKRQRVLKNMEISVELGTLEK